MYFFLKKKKNLFKILLIQIHLICYNYYYNLLKYSISNKNTILI